MARDARGRWLPNYDPESEDQLDGRHLLTRHDRQKGYQAAALMGKLPSRLRAWLRSKIRFYYLRRRAGRGAMRPPPSAGL
jgi:hypothetical protein